MRFGLQADSESEQEKNVKVVPPLLPSTSKYGLFDLSDEDDDYLSEEPYEPSSSSDDELQVTPLPVRRRTVQAVTAAVKHVPAQTTPKRRGGTPIKVAVLQRTEGVKVAVSPLARSKTTPTRPPMTPLPRTSLSSRYDILQRSLTKPAPVAAAIPPAKPGLVAYDSEDSESDDAHQVVPLPDYSTIPNYQPTEPQAFREAKWTAYRDPSEEWERQAKEASLRRAHNSFRLLATRASQVRRTRDDEILRTIEQTQNKEMEEVERLLKGMRMRQEEEDRVLKAAHERRKRDLWERVDQALRFESEAEMRRKEQERKRKEEEERQERERLAAEERRTEEEERQAREKLQREQEEREREEQERRRQDEEERKQHEERVRLQEEQAALEKEASEREFARAREEEEVRKGLKWDIWTEELRRESAVMRGKAENMQNAVIAIDEGDKPRPIKKACSDARRGMRKALSTITRELSVISRIAKQCQKYLADACIADEDAYGYLLHHFAASVVERAEEATDFRDVYPLAHCCRLLMTEGGVARSVANALYFALVRETWVVEGVRPPKPEGMSSTEWETTYGKRREDEPSLTYAARIANYVGLYAATCQSDIATDDDRLPPQWTLDALWKRLASLLRPPQDGDWLVPHAVAAIIQVAGKRLEEVYGELLFSKLRQYLLTVCTPGAVEKEQLLGREDMDETASAGREKLVAILRGWDKDKLSEGREWEDDLPGGSYLTIEGSYEAGGAGGAAGGGGGGQDGDMMT